MPSVKSVLPFAGVGVTSILPVPTVFHDDIDISNSNDNEHILLSFYVGTKRGKMKKITMKNSKKKGHDYDVDIQCIEDDDDGSTNSKKTPYPIFSMMSLSINHDHYHVLSGSGDRYITIWEEQDMQQQQHQGDGGVSSWRIKAKLGPHTGWVKDLASLCLPYRRHREDGNNKDKEEEEKFIFSIGCNCIEVWRTIHGETYDHIHKLMIESSVEMGSTLSSDILCLAISPLYHNTKQMSNQAEEKQQNHHHSYCLFAGGVDGRIHQWTICNNSFLDAEVVYAPGHDGRVNALLVCNDLRAAVSIGNDGFVKCWMLDCDDPFMQRSSVWSINENNEHIVQEETNTIKLTCSCILLETQDLAIIGIGTACGKVLLAEISSNRSSSNRLSITLLDERTVVKSSSSNTKGDCTIHSLASQNNHIIIGHSEGISIWEPDL
jgi:hypothetical protein